MYSKKTLIAAAALAVLSAAGSASAAPWEHHEQRVENRVDHRMDRRADRIEHRHYADRIRIDEALRLRHYRMIGEPYFVHGHYVVRTHNRFGRSVFVEIDPYSGMFVGEFRL